MNSKSNIRKTEDPVEFDSKGFYVDQKDQIHIAPWKKTETDLLTKWALEYLRAGGDPHGRK